MNNVTPKLKKAGHTKLPSKPYKNAEATKILLQSAFYTSKGKVLHLQSFTFLRLLV